MRGSSVTVGRSYLLPSDISRLESILNEEASDAPGPRVVPRRPPACVQTERDCPGAGARPRATIPPGARLATHTRGYRADTALGSPAVTEPGRRNHQRGSGRDRSAVRPPARLR